MWKYMKSIEKLCYFDIIVIGLKYVGFCVFFCVPKFFSDYLWGSESRRSVFFRRKNTWNEHLQITH